MILGLKCILNNKVGLKPDRPGCHELGLESLPTAVRNKTCASEISTRMVGKGAAAEDALTASLPEMCRVRNVHILPCVGMPFDQQEVTGGYD